MLFFQTANSLSGENFSFLRGEEIEFRVHYGSIPAGYITLFAKQDSVRGKEALHFTLKARTKGGFSLIFRVEDEIHSYVDRDSFFTLRYEKSLKEGKYKKKLWADYFSDSGIAKYSDGYTVPLTRGALDPLSLLYYVRILDLKVGDTIHVPYHVDKKNSVISIVVEGRDSIDTSLGRYSAFIVKPDVHAKNIFKGKGEMKLWISEKSPHYLLKIQTKVFFGHLTAEIIRYRQKY